MGRICKTEKSIYESFFKLRKKNHINKIRVKDICEMANVTRSTFYDYFEDVYDLTRKLECLIIIESFKGFNTQEVMYTNSAMFLSDFKIRLNKYIVELTILGKGREQELLFNIENEIDNLFPVDLEGTKKKILIAFIIGGSVHVLEKHRLFDKKYDYESVNKQLEEITETLLSSFVNKTSK